MKEFLKLVSIWWFYRQKFHCTFFTQWPIS